MNQRDLRFSGFALKHHPSNILIYLNPNFYSTPCLLIGASFSNVYNAPLLLRTLRLLRILPDCFTRVVNNFGNPRKSLSSRTCTNRQVFLALLHGSS